MGEHETQPSRKRFKKGSAVKYRHPMFHRDSTPETLMKITRRTTPLQELQEVIKSTQDRMAIVAEKKRKIEDKVRIAKAHLVLNELPLHKKTKNVNAAVKLVELEANVTTINETTNTTTTNTATNTAINTLSSDTSAQFQMLEPNEDIEMFFAIGDGMELHV